VWTFLSRKYGSMMNNKTNFGLEEAGMKQLDDCVGQLLKHLDDIPVFTPAIKAESGHDENISRARLASIVGAPLAAQLERLSLALYTFGAAYAQQRGLLLADTKFEFGHLDGQLILIDEALTPDSSRYWPADDFEPGRAQASFDKQFLRDFLEA